MYKHFGNMRVFRSLAILLALTVPTLGQAPSVANAAERTSEMKQNVRQAERSRDKVEVERGAAFIITRRGRPVAKLVPAPPEKAGDPEWAAAWDRMMARLEEGAPLGGHRVAREDARER